MTFERQSRKISYLALAGMTLLMVGAIVIFALNTRNYSRAAMNTKKTTVFMQQVQTVWQRVSDAESGERGYLLTHNEKYLVPFLSAKELLVNDLKALEDQAASNPEQAAQVRELIQLIDARTKLLAQIIALEKSGDHHGAMSILLSNQGRRYMERIRDLANRLVAEESDILQSRFQHDNEVRREMLTMVVIIILTSAALLASALYLSYRDARLRQLAERALRESESQLRLILDTSQDYAIFMMDVQGRVVKWSGGAAHVKGYSSEEILGKHVSQFYTPHDLALDKPNSELDAARRMGRMEVRAKRRKKDGTVFWADVVITAMRDDKGELIGFSEMTRDITPQVLTEEALAAAKESAERANATKSRFLAFISHELRTPLGSILGFSDLGASPEVSDQERRSYLAIIKRNANQLLTMINDLLDLSKIEAGRLEINETTFAVKDFARELIDLFTPLATSKGVRFSVNYAADMPQLITTDQVRLKQVITNLVGNALKFTAQGEVCLSICCSSHDHKRGDLVFEVTDTGIGIPNEAQSRIFAPYFQADKSTTQKYGGTGLGLALSRALTRALGGELSLVESQVGKGSRFRAIISASLHHDTVTQSVAHPLERRPLQGCHILVVDDSDDTRAYLKTILEAAGADVQEASDGVDAIERCKDHPFDTVLMDLQMPRCDGMEATRIMKRHGFGKPVVALTAQVLALLADTDEALFQALLFKPVSPDRLVETVASAIGT